MTFFGTENCHELTNDTDVRTDHEVDLDLDLNLESGLISDISPLL